MTPATPHPPTSGAGLSAGLRGKPIEPLPDLVYVPVSLLRLTISDDAFRLYAVLQPEQRGGRLRWPPIGTLLDRLPPGTDEDALWRARGELLHHGCLVDAGGGWWTLLVPRVEAERPRGRRTREPMRQTALAL